MLSTTKRFLFIHVPKTGGNSIQDALRPYADDAIVAIAPHQDGVERFELRSDQYATHKHSTLREYRQAYGDALFASLFKFACVRNPWDRAVSFYFSPHRGEVKWDRKCFCDFVATIAPVGHYLTLAPDQRLADAVRHIDCLLRFETLQSDFARACEAVDIPEPTLRVRNKSSRLGSYRDYYDAETAKVVATRFEEEIDVFGYYFI